MLIFDMDPQPANLDGRIILAMLGMREQILNFSPKAISQLYGCNLVIGQAEE